MAIANTIRLPSVILIAIRLIPVSLMYPFGVVTWSAESGDGDDTVE
jgi:hypothetical protein